MLASLRFRSLIPWHERIRPPGASRGRSARAGHPRVPLIPLTPLPGFLGRLAGVCDTETAGRGKGLRGDPSAGSGATEDGRKPLAPPEDRPSPGGRGSGPKRSGVPDPLPAGEAGVKAPQRGAEGQRPLGGFCLRPKGRTDLAKPSRKCALRGSGPFHQSRGCAVRTVAVDPRLPASRARSAPGAWSCPCRPRSRSARPGVASCRRAIRCRAKGDKSATDRPSDLE